MIVWNPLAPFLLWGLMQEPQTVVWLLGKALSAVACLGMLVWLIAGVLKRAWPRLRAASTKQTERSRVELK